MNNLNTIKIITISLLMVLTPSCVTLQQPVTEKAESQQSNRGLLMVLDAISFAEGQAVLLPTTEEKLDKFTKIIQESGNKVVLIEGYSDNLGDPEENLTLSKHRAEAVRDALITRGVASNRLIADGFGHSRPIASNHTEEGRRKNRRVEIVIINEKAE